MIILREEKKIDFYLVKMKLEDMLFFDKRENKTCILGWILVFYKSERRMIWPKGSQQEGVIFVWVKLKEKKRRNQSTNLEKKE